jgi:acyl-CoA synthetase (NDP forming)
VADIKSELPVRNLKRLLSPSSIAVIGGGAWCRSVVQQCLKIGFDGHIWPVHPTQSSIHGIPTVSSVQDLPNAPDASFIGINREATVSVVQALNDMGAGGAVCFASGFAEAATELKDGADLQHRLVQAAGTMPILGPNCYGFINYLDGALLWPDQHGGRRFDRGVALITQSSNIAINLTMQTRGVPLAYVATVGNQAQTGLSELGLALLDDDRVTALGLYIEGLDDLPAFERLAEYARSRGKGIVAVKVGASDQARLATVSHTASLTGSDAGSRALLKRCGVAQVGSLAALLETLKILHIAGPLRSNTVASMSCSGGEASLMADSGIAQNIVYPALNDVQRVALRKALGPRVALANPLDYHTYIWPDSEKMAAAYTAMMQSDALGIGCVVADFPRSDLCDPSEWESVITGVAAANSSGNTPVAIVSSLSETMPEAVSQRLVDQSIIPLNGIPEALEAIAAAAFLGQETTPIDPVLTPTQPVNVALISEFEAKQRLTRAGLSIPISMQADSTTLNSDSIDMPFPVVLKSVGTAHKSDTGGVVIDLRTPEQLTEAVKSFTGSVLVEEMITDGVVELLVGIVIDPPNGFILTLAAGGTMTEILADSTSLIVPASHIQVKQALNSLRIARVFGGYRGKPAINLEAVVDAVMAIQSYVITNHGRISEVEVNPLICTPTRAIAADALIREGERTDGQPN